MVGRTGDSLPFDARDGPFWRPRFRWSSSSMDCACVSWVFMSPVGEDECGWGENTVGGTEAIRIADGDTRCEGSSVWRTETGRFPPKKSSEKWIPSQTRVENCFPTCETVMKLGRCWGRMYSIQWGEFACRWRLHDFWDSDVIGEISRPHVLNDVPESKKWSGK